LAEELHKPSKATVSVTCEEDTSFDKMISPVAVAFIYINN
jgi:hypothetical protein